MMLTISAVLAIEQIATLDWYLEPDGMLRVDISLVAGGAVGTVVNTNPDDGGGLGWAMRTAFDQLQQDLPETDAFWGQAMPPCRLGHPHPADCRESDTAVELYCPNDLSTLRVLALLT